MPHAIYFTKRIYSWSAKATMVALAAALAFSAMQASAEEPSRSSTAAEILRNTSLADLETAFWACDYAATFYGVLDFGTAVFCGAATSEFRARKFNDDFNAMLKWWKQHKATEHQALHLRSSGGADRERCIEEFSATFGCPACASVHAEYSALRPAHVLRHSCLQ